MKQDSRKGAFFPKGELAKTKGNYNTRHPTWQLYAHLNQRYDQFRDSTGKMELQLRYPELAVKTLTWKQASAPNSKTVTGYEIEKNQQHDFDGGEDFNGMALSSNRATFLDGQTTHRNWWYAVGSSTSFGGGIPGPKGTQTKATNTKVREVQLWVRNPAAVTQVDKEGWTLLVKQDSTQGNFFQSTAAIKAGEYSRSTASRLYANVPSDSKFYGQFRDAESKMQFQLRWPELESKTLTWKQTSAPTATKVTGYEIEKNQKHDYDGSADFNGIAVSTLHKSWTYLDGQTTHRNWWYAVGSLRAFYTGIPGPRGSQTKSEARVVKRVELWVKKPAAPAVTVTKEGWTLLVKQDSSTGIFFNKEMVKNGDQYADNSNAHLYAHLTRDYNSFRSTDGKMTFQLRYPDLTGDKTLTWKQSSTPMSTSVLGFEIDVTQRNHWHGTASAFNGMAKSSSRSTLLDGQTTHPHWFYAVATTNAWRNGIPGPRLLDGKLVTGIKRAEFWVKNIEHSNPVNCKDWTCAEWCQFFDVDAESAGVYADQDCNEDGGDECSC